MVSLVPSLWASVFHSPHCLCGELLSKCMPTLECTLKFKEKQRPSRKWAQEWTCWASLSQEERTGISKPWCIPVPFNMKSLLHRCSCQRIMDNGWMQELQNPLSASVEAICSRPWSQGLNEGCIWLLCLRSDYWWLFRASMTHKASLMISLEWLCH